eukprot:576400-Rhodomonas_salina.1
MAEAVAAGLAEEDAFLSALELSLTGERGDVCSAMRSGSDEKGTEKLGVWLWGVACSCVQLSCVRVHVRVHVRVRVRVRVR